MCDDTRPGRPAPRAADRQPVPPAMLTAAPPGGAALSPVYSNPMCGWPCHSLAHGGRSSEPNCSSDTTAAATTYCSSSQGPSPVTHGQAITPPSSAPPLGETWTLYDDYGNELYTTAGVYEPGSNTAAYSQTTYQLYKDNTITLGGDLISCTATPPSATTPCATIDANGIVTPLAYKAQGDLTSSSTPDGSGSELATTYGYEGDGEQLQLSARTET